MFYKCATFLLDIFFKYAYGLSCYGNQEPYKGKAILAPNHASFLDPPLIASTWPETVHFLARSSLFQSWWQKQILTHLCAHPVEGTIQDLASFRLICRLLENENKVVMFPEGERSVTGEIQPIKSGIAMLAMRMNCPIIPVYLQGTYKAWPKHKKFPNLGSSIVCVYGQPIFPEKEGLQNKKKTQEELTQKVQNKLLALKQWLDDGKEGPIP